MKRTELTSKYETYREIGHAVFTVTLSTYVQSDPFAASDRMRHYWDQHFIYRIKKCLPLRAKLDHDWILEKPPHGNYHCHGLLAIEYQHSKKLWTEAGLSTKLSRALDSHARTGDYRPFKVNAYLIEPATNVQAWSNYITKQVRPFAK